jgi:ribosomal protein L11 methyltransferase
VPYAQLSFTTRYPEFAEEVLLAHGALSVSLVEPDDAVPILEPAPGETPLWTVTGVDALFPEHLDCSAVITALRSTLPDGASLSPAQSRVEDRDWVRQCLEDMQPMRFGRRLWVCPHHRSVSEDDAVVVRMDPGLAFGTGTHPSTALCLQWLDGAQLRGARVLDFGCGSGILAIAALQLGAIHATAVDLDSQALQATRDNARANGMDDRVTTTLPRDFRPQPYDVVLANILAGPLQQLAPLLTDCCRRGGSIVLAGVLDRQAAEVAAAYAGAFEMQSMSCDGWTRLSAIRH